MSDTDTRYFDIEFTDESVELTPPDDAEPPTEFSPISEAEEDSRFSSFSYQVLWCCDVNVSTLRARIRHVRLESDLNVSTEHNISSEQCDQKKIARCL